MISKFNIFKDKLFESLPRQSTVDQLKRIRDEILKSQIVKVGPESSKTSGDVGDKVIDDLVKHKGKQEMNNLFWWDNPLDRYICSYEDFVKKDARGSLGYTIDGDTKPKPTDIPDKDPKNTPKQSNKMLGLDIVDEIKNKSNEMKKIKENNEPGIEVTDLKGGINKKLNNLLNFEDFEKQWKPEEAKKTKRTDVGLDIVKEKHFDPTGDGECKLRKKKGKHFDPIGNKDEKTKNKKKVEENNEPGIEVSDLKGGIDKKLNNLLDFDDFEKTLKPEEQKKTKRTEVGLDIVKEDQDTHNYPVPISLRGKEKLPDNDQWTNRFEIESETSDRIYIVAQNKSTGIWGCSCPAWRTRRYCKHLGSLGLLGAGPEDKKRLGGR
jgi:hypothetical protein